MKKIIYRSAFITLFALLQFDSFSQIKFKLERLDLTNYRLSLVCQKSLSSSESITGTMQVSLRAASSDGFIMDQPISVNPEVKWSIGTILKSPKENPDYDYFAVTLSTMGIKDFLYQEGVDIPLFTFKNIGSNTKASIHLIENETDQLATDTGSSFNIRNHISIIGYGYKNAYLGNIESNAENALPLLRGIKLSPNPANTYTRVEWQNLIEHEKGVQVALSIVNVQNGVEIDRKLVDSGLGEFSQELDLSNYTIGNYLVYLLRNGLRTGNALKLQVLH